jgi:hypothetical protein
MVLDLKRFIFRLGGANDGTDLNLLDRENSKFNG